MKQMNRLTEALIFLKKVLIYLIKSKALQYIWFINDKEGEANIYDQFGVVYFLQGEIEMAE
jgi:hypothetical protein